MILRPLLYFVDQQFGEPLRPKYGDCEDTLFSMQDQRYNVYVEVAFDDLIS